MTLGTSTRASLVSGSLRVRSCCRHAQAYRAFADDPDVGYPATHDARTILWHLAFVGIDTGDLAQIESAAIDAVDAPPTATATTPTPEVGSSGTRSCAVSNITNGQDIAARPSALYVTCNLEVVGNGGGWVEVDYGVGGNVTQLTVHGECTSGSNPEEHGTRRVEDLSGNWVCETEQHFEYRWDELNRIVEARRWDRTGGYSSASGWTFEARQRYRYDGANQRTVKESFDTSLGDSRVALHVYPGDFERRGVLRGSLAYETPSTGFDTETQYLVAGARLVWNHAPISSPGDLDRSRRLTVGVTDLIQTTAATVDLLSGELLEVSTYYPNGARETLRTNAGAAVPLEPMGFTGKEADEDVGLVYFGERYLLARLGRWASPDPLHVHASGGGEALNSYHYVSGSLLQSRDPNGLDPEPNHPDYIIPLDRHVADPTGANRDLRAYLAPRRSHAENAVFAMDASGTLPGMELFICDGPCRFGSRESGLGEAVWAEAVRVFSSPSGRGDGEPEPFWTWPAALGAILADLMTTLNPEPARTPEEIREQEAATSRVAVLGGVAVLGAVVAGTVSRASGGRAPVPGEGGGADAATMAARRATGGGGSVSGAPTPPDPGAIARARAARDAAGLRADGRPDRRSAAYVGIVRDGEVAVGRARDPGVHAEVAADAELPGGTMTEVMGWRRNRATGALEWREIAVCPGCQERFGPERFVEGTVRE